MHYRGELGRIVIELSSRLSTSESSTTIFFNLHGIVHFPFFDPRETFLIHASSPVRVKTPILVNPSIPLAPSSNFSGGNRVKHRGTN